MQPPHRRRNPDFLGAPAARHGVPLHGSLQVWSKVWTHILVFHAISLIWLGRCSDPFPKCQVASLFEHRLHVRNFTMTVHCGAWPAFKGVCDGLPLLTRGPGFKSWHGHSAERSVLFGCLHVLSSVLYTQRASRHAPHKAIMLIHLERKLPLVWPQNPLQLCR
jgi:hypothetical protein